MIESSTLGSQIGRRRPARKIYPEKVCAFCSGVFTPKNAQAAKSRYFCYDWKCEQTAETMRDKAARQRQKARKGKGKANGNAVRR